MAYSTTNPPNCIIPRMGEGGTALWAYRHTDIHTDVDASGYFTNGSALGMKVGDVMFVSKSDATIGATLHYVTTVTAGGAATIAPAILA
jgi:hypothetical protein